MALLKEELKKNEAIRARKHEWYASLGKRLWSMLHEQKLSKLPVEGRQYRT